MTPTPIDRIAGLGRTLLVAGALSLAATAQAVPITYTLTGVATGSLRSFSGNESAFADRPFVITIGTDTSNIGTARFGVGLPATTALVRGSIDLVGVLNSAFSDSLYVFNNQASQTVGFGDLVHNDLLSIRNMSAGLGSYGLVTNLGPITGFNNAMGQFTSVVTDLGGLSFTRIDSPTFQAALAAVPEPQTWGLMLAGLAWVGALARRRARH